MTHPCSVLQQRSTERASPAALGQGGVLRLTEARGHRTPLPSNGEWNRVVLAKWSHPILFFRSLEAGGGHSLLHRNEARETADGIPNRAED